MILLSLRQQMMFKYDCNNKMQTNNKMSIEGGKTPGSYHEHVLNNFKQRKFSQQEDPRYNLLNKKKSSKYQRFNFNSLDKDISLIEQQCVFTTPKETINFKKQYHISPNKIAQNSRLYETLQGQALKKQIEELKGFYNPVNVPHHPELSSGQQIPCIQSNSKQFCYQPYKRKANIAKQKLKPIVSEATMRQGQLQFFNVGKMVLNNQNQKSKSVKIKPLHSFKDSADGSTNPTIDAVYMRERLKVSSQAVYIHQNRQKSKKDLFSQIDPMIIQTVQPKSVYGQNQVKFRKQTQSLLNQIYQENNMFSNQKSDKYLPRITNDDTPKDKKQHKVFSMKKIEKKFNPPYETYYYRDLIWKVNFSNRILVQFPIEYEHRLKAYVGKGNNSCMVNGLIARRSWFAFTDKPEQANFVWTQLKVLSYYKRQQIYEKQIIYDQNNKQQYISDSILTDHDQRTIKSYFKTHFSIEEHADEKMIPRMKNFKYERIIKANQIKETKMHNHLINNYVLGNKKALFNTMTNYYIQNHQHVFDFLPLTFHIKDGLEDKKYFQFLKYYHKRAKQIVKNHDKNKPKQYNAWIVKPGENSNRGNGIKMCLNIQQVKSILRKRQRYPDGSFRTFIVQSYIQRPLLYFKRKFDIRHYIMMTCINGIVKGYWYKYGYVRTTSSEYSLKDNSGSIHLTNDAVQKNLADYGKYEKGNKISYDDLNAYIDKYHHKPGTGFYKSIYPKMKRIGTDAMKACSGGIDPSKFQNNFEVFGMDFMIDANLQVWLIQINTNPCLELSCPLLGCIIPKMVENALELTMDTMFPPPIRYAPKGLHYYKQLERQNKFELVYDERVEPLCQGSLQVLDNKLLEEQDDTFQDCGQEWEDK